jgi:hypothetical protein
VNWRCAGQAAAVAAAAVCVPPPGAQAAEWTWGGSLTGRLEQVTNATYAVSAAPASSRRTLSATGDLAGRAEDWNAGLNANYTFNDSSTPSLGLDAYGFGVNGSRRFERDTLGLVAFMRRESALTSAPGSSGTSPGSSGTSYALARRQTTSLAPNWQRALSERWTLNASTNLQAVSYDRRKAGLVDYSDASASAGLTYTFSPRMDLRLGANAQRFRTDPAATKSDTVSVTAGIKYLLSDYWTLDASYGATRVKSRFSADSRVCPAPAIFCENGEVPFTVVATNTAGTISGSTWNATSSYVPDERSSFALFSSRSVGPSGGGSQSVTQNTGLGYAYRFSDHLIVRADGALGRSATVGASKVGPATHSRQASASLAWQFAERWSLDAGARWYQSRLSAGSSPASATFFVSLRYDMARQNVTQW